MRKNVDYWDVIFCRYYWCERHQLECDNYFRSYLRLNKEICSLEEEGFSRDETEYEGIWG